MHPSSRRAARLLLTALFALAAVDCGPGPAGGLMISFSSRALLADADRLAIAFYDGQEDCMTIREAVPPPAPAFGPYDVALDAEARENGILFELEEIPVGTYLVFVDALGAAGGRVGSGCSTGQRVFDRQVSPIQVVISEG